MKIRLVTVVWGKSFVDIFLRVTLRTLLAEGNMPALATRHQCAYRIYTTEQDAVVIRQSPLFRRLAQAIDVEILTFDQEGFDLTTHATHWHVWRRAYELAKRDREIVFLIIPDAIFSTGTMLRWAELFEQGYRAVWTAGPQVVLETGLEELEKRFPPALSPGIHLNVTDVHQLMIRHLHPLIINMFRDSNRWLPHPEGILREVPGNGISMRILGSHPFCFDPNYFSVTDAFSPVDRLEAIAFDQGRFICLEAMTKYCAGYYRPMRMDDTQLSNVGSWVDWFCAPSDMLKSYFSYRFRAHEQIDERKFRRAEQALGVYASQFRITGAVYRVARALKQAGCHKAAQFLAAAQLEGRLRRHWRIKGPVTILVPSDEAIDALPADRRVAFLKPGNEKALVDAVLAHVVAGTLELAPGDKVRAGQESDGHAEAANGTSVSFTKTTGATIVSGPIQQDACTIYVIDRDLAAKVNSVPTKKPSVGVLPDGWAAPAGRLGVPSPPPPVPPPPPSPPSLPVAAPPRSLRRLIKRGILAVLLRIYRPLAGVPGIESRARKALASYRRMRGNGGLLLFLATADIPRDPRARLADLQGARVQLIIAGILRFYQAKVADIFPRLSTLALAEKRVRRVGFTDEHIIRSLQGLVADAPKFADAWLELAYAHLDRGEFDDVVKCTDRALAGNGILPAPAGSTPTAALALFARARALVALDRLDEAAQAYQSGFERGGPPGLTSVHFARLLRRLGRYEEALRYFYDGLQLDVTWPRLQKFDVDALPQRLSALR